MPGEKTPGPLGQQQPPVNDGTLARQPSPKPGPVGAAPKVGSRLWRQKITLERQITTASLKSKGSPTGVEDALATLALARALVKRYEAPQDPNHRSFFDSREYLDPDVSSEDYRVAAQSVEKVYDWLSSFTTEDNIHFCFSGREGLRESYTHVNWLCHQAVMDVGDIRRYLRERTVVPDGVWRDNLRTVENASSYLEVLIKKKPIGDITTSAKVFAFIFLGVSATIAVVALPAALLAVGEGIALVDAGLLAAWWAIPGGATVLALVVENFVLAEVIAYFAVGTVVTILDSGGFEGFGERLKTPEGAFQAAADIVVFIVQVRGARGQGPRYVRVETQRVGKTPRGTQLKVLNCREVHPPAEPETPPVTRTAAVGGGGGGGGTTTASTPANPPTTVIRVGGGPGTTAGTESTDRPGGGSTTTGAPIGRAPVPAPVEEPPKRQLVGAGVGAPGETPAAVNAAKGGGKSKGGGESAPGKGSSGGASPAEPGSEGPTPTSLRLKAKPTEGDWKYPPNWDKWKDKGGTVTAHPDGSVTYTNKAGVSVRYSKDGHPDFSPHLNHPSGVKEVPVKSTPDRRADFRQANKLAAEQAKANGKDPSPFLNTRGEPHDESPDGYTWHHHENGTTIQLVPRDTHGEFKHAGGVSASNE